MYQASVYFPHSSCQAAHQPESIFLILSQSRKNLVSSIVSTAACLISFQSRMNDLLFAFLRHTALHLINHRLVPLIKI